MGFMVKESASALKVSKSTATTKVCVVTFACSGPKMQNNYHQPQFSSGLRLLASFVLAFFFWILSWPKAGPGKHRLSLDLGLPPKA